MKKIIAAVITIIALALLGLNIDNLTNKLAEMLKNEPTVIVNTPNTYFKNASYKYVSMSDNYIPYSKTDIRNIFFSVLNSGANSLTFYCPAEYAECTNDVNEISTNQDTLTHINNFVNPFNSFKDLQVTYDESGEVTIAVNKAYTKEEINLINNKIDSIINQTVTNDMETEDKILIIHDTIINTTKYDQARLIGESQYKSNLAYGPLIEGYGICGGYADAMALFLNRWDVPNFKVASDTHVWNAVYLNDTWLHLDLTWDDPVTEGSDIDNLIHKFYLITTNTLEEYKINDHHFDKTIYRELLN